MVENYNTNLYNIGSVIELKCSDVYIRNFLITLLTYIHKYENRVE